MRRDRHNRRKIGALRPLPLTRFDRQDLAALVIAAGRAGGVRSDRAAALRAFIELRRLPAMRCLARAQAHLRGFAFWNSHKSGSGKQEIRKRQMAQGSAVRSGCLASAARILEYCERAAIYLRSFNLSSALQSGGRSSSTALSSAFLILRRRTHPAAFAIAMRIGRQIKQDIFAQKRRQIDSFRSVQFGVHRKSRTSISNEIFPDTRRNALRPVASSPVGPERTLGNRRRRDHNATARATDFRPIASSGIGQSSSPSRCNPSAGIWFR